MKSISFSFAALALAGALPGPALGAPVSYAAVYEAGRCIVGHDYRRALALIVALPADDSAADLSMLRGSSAEPCAAGAADASAMLVRGAIAQALFRRDFGAFGRDPRSDARLVNLELPAQDGSGGGRNADLYRWGDCVVRNGTRATQRLLVSAPGSEEERAAMGALQPYMTPCMPAGANLTVRLGEARAIFAQSAYHAMYRYATGQLRMTTQAP